MENNFTPPEGAICRCVYFDGTCHDCGKTGYRPAGLENNTQEQALQQEAEELYHNIFSTKWTKTEVMAEIINHLRAHSFDKKKVVSDAWEACRQYIHYKGHGGEPKPNKEQYLSSLNQTQQ
jgi:hypothetical protein